MNYIYKSLLQFCLWCEIPLKLIKVYIINVQDCGIAGIDSLLGAILCKNNEKNDKFYREVAFLMIRKLLILASKLKSSFETKTTPMTGY